MLRFQKLAYEDHLMQVVHSGDARELKRFLEQKEGKLDVNFFDKEGQTALHHSCTDGNFELVKLLLKFGADPRLANRDGWNPLHIASFSGHHDIMLYLIGGSPR
jgi:ankyrin repeat protein